MLHVQCQHCGSHANLAVLYIDIVKILITEGAATDGDTLEEFFMSSVLNGKAEMVKALMVESAKIKYDTLNTAYMIAL